MLHSFSWQTPVLLWPTNLQGHTLLETHTQTNKQIKKQEQNQKATSKTNTTQNKQNKRQSLSLFIIWLNPQAGKMKLVIRSDWLPERSKMGLSCPLGISRVGPTRKSSLVGHIINLL